MRKYFDKCKLSVMLMAFAVALGIPSVVSEAQTISKKVTSKVTACIGDEVFVSGTGLKINKKAASKFKKKIKTVKTGTGSTTLSYRKAYFKDSDAYSQYDDYREATDNADKFVSYSNYTLRFLKSGTYTISYVDYSKESLSMDYDSYKGGVSYYRLVNNDGKSSTELYARKETNSGEYYYQGVSSKAIYAEGEDDLVAASIRIGADKLQHVYYQPRNLIKTTYSTQYKVLKTAGVISSVQLGKTKLTRKDSRNAYSSSSSSSRSFLTGNSGKLTVKMANSNYGITSIVVRTYDKNGKPVYKKVSNKKNLGYGLYKRKETGYNYSDTSLYKETTVYVSYKNKFTGEFSQINSITTDAYGAPVFSVTYRKKGETKNTTVTSSAMPSSYTSSFTFYKR